MRDVLDTRKIQPTINPHTGVFESQQSDSLLISYVGKNPPLHIRRTLDQYHYSRLKDTKMRDCDQVVTRARNENLKFQYSYTSPEFSDWCSNRERFVQGLLNYSPQITEGIEEREEDIQNQTQLIIDLDKVERDIDMSLAGVKDEDLPQKMQKRFQDSPIIIVDQLWLWALDESRSFLLFTKTTLTRTLPDRDCDQ